MLDLLITTLEMMGLTFVIGFFVAFIIKMIAVAADSFDFYSSHQKELLRLRRLRKLRQKVELMIRDIPMVFLSHIGTIKKTDTSIFMEQKKDIKWIV